MTIHTIHCGARRMSVMHPSHVASPEAVRRSNTASRPMPPHGDKGGSKKQALLEALVEDREEQS